MRSAALKATASAALLVMIGLVLVWWARSGPEPERAVSSARAGRSPERQALAVTPQDVAAGLPRRPVASLPAPLPKNPPHDPFRPVTAAPRAAPPLSGRDSLAASPPPIRPQAAQPPLTGGVPRQGLGDPLTGTRSGGMSRTPPAIAATPSRPRADAAHPVYGWQTGGLPPPGAPITSVGPLEIFEVGATDGANPVLVIENGSRNPIVYLRVTLRGPEARPRTVTRMVPAGGRAQISVPPGTHQVWMRTECHAPDPGRAIPAARAEGTVTLQGNRFYYGRYIPYGVPGRSTRITFEEPARAVPEPQPLRDAEPPMKPAPEEP